MSDRTIWKFELDILAWQQVWLPHGAHLLTVQMQGEHPCLWAAVDPLAATAPLTVLMVGTGHPIPPTAGRYLGTVQQIYQANTSMYGGRYSLVWHFFAEQWEVIDA